jgi:hypothetical protein
MPSRSRPDRRVKHIGQTLAATGFRYYEERGLRSAFYDPVDEDNVASCRLAESFGGRGRNLYTAYEKRLG